MHLRQGHECTEAGRRGGPASGGGGRSFKTGVLTALSAFSSLAARFMLDLEGAESGGWSCIDWSCTETPAALAQSRSRCTSSTFDPFDSRPREVHIFRSRSTDASNSIGGGPGEASRARAPVPSRCVRPRFRLLAEPPPVSAAAAAHTAPAVPPPVSHQRV